MSLQPDSGKIQNIFKTYFHPSIAKIVNWNTKNKHKIQQFVTKQGDETKFL